MRKKIYFSFFFAFFSGVVNGDGCPDEGKQCEADCVDDHIHCLVDCVENNSFPDDQACMSKCNRDEADCESYCPCFSRCPHGCPCEYHSDYCVDVNLPDYNDDEYTFNCVDDDNCVLTMSDGQTFLGIRIGTIINFLGIPFAHAPIGTLRWTSPRLKKNYKNEPVNARQMQYGCATYWAGDRVFN